jgi:hypothetical protein
MLPPIVIEFLEAIVKAVFDSALEHLPQLEAEWESLHTTHAADAKADPALADALYAELAGAAAAGKVPAP